MRPATRPGRGRPSRRAPWSCWAGGALLAAGCGGEPAGGGAAPTAQRLELRSLNPAPVAVPRVVGSYAGTDEGWTFVGARVHPSNQYDGELIIESTSGKIEIGLPADVDPGEFNRLVLTLRPSTTVGIHVRGGAPGEAGPIGSGIRVRGSGEPVPVTFDLAELDLRRPGLSRRLSLLLPGEPRGPLGLVSAALVRSPLESDLPTPEAGEAFLVLDGEEREAVGLASGRPLGTSFRADPGAVLSIAHGVPSQSRPDEAEHRVVLTLDDTAGRRVVRELASGGRWSTERIELDGLGLEGEVSALLELACDRPGEALVALQRPVLFWPAPRPGTVLMITSDTHRADHLGLLGGPVEVSTPHLDALAEAGTCFRDAISVANVTTPSHVSMMTGVAPWVTGLATNEQRLSDAPTTLAERFRDAGWETWAAVSVRHLSDEESGLGQGFDRIYTSSSATHEAEVTLERVHQWLPEAEGRPLFLWLHLFDVHTPYHERDEFTRLYYPPERDPRSAELEPLEAWQTPRHQEDVRDLEYIRALYRAEVSYLDEQLGRLLAQARFQDAVVAFTGDHGESLSEHGLYFTHSGLYPQTLRVPLILKGPGVEAGVVDERPVENIDLGRTLLALAEIEPGDFPGHSLLEGGGERAPRFALAARGVSAAIYHDQWLFVLHLQGHDLNGLVHRPVEQHSSELYDLRTDPECLQDVVHEHRERARALRTALIEELSRGGASDWQEDSAAQDLEALDALEQLGYTTSGTAWTQLWFDTGCECEHCLSWRPGSSSRAGTGGSPPGGAAGAAPVEKPAPRSHDE